MSKKEANTYKDTLLLPKTDFPMRASLVEREPERLKQWEEADLYGKICAKRKSEGAPKYILHDGPPFANGDVHMGTALNKILKDLVVKSKSMAGHYCPYIPGWDCHGLPIEFKVVQEAQGLEPAEIRRRSEEFARKFIDIQRNSFRRLGVLGDWYNPYLTLSPEYEADIVRVFAKLAERGLVYSSEKPVQWSFGAQTALAEAEVEYKDVKDTAIFVKFPLVDGDLGGKSSIVIWTTTPWTLPANLGIAVHPRFVYVSGSFSHEDGRTEELVVAKDLLEQFASKTGFSPSGEMTELKGESLAGNKAQHPFLDRTSLVLLAEFVTTETGTGAVHIAPGHGADDYVAGIQNGLEVLSPVDNDGKFTAEAGLEQLVGQHVFKSNEPIIELLDESHHLVGREDYSHSYPHCWRSKTPIIFRAVPQFFIKIDALRETALGEIDEAKWLPHWGRNRIYGTVESRPDWCISRQRTWGVPLPVFYDEAGEPLIDADRARKVADLFEEGGTNLWFEKDDAWWNAELGLPDGTTRCKDTLDVWIDSGSSHVAVMDRHPELETPADLYLEATDQHRGWFQSSLMLSVAYRGKAPYKSVLTHGFVTDPDGKKISKSGKPLDAQLYFDKYGADNVRLWAASVDWQAEVPLNAKYKGDKFQSDNLFEQVIDTYRRIRNTLRILLGNLDQFDHEAQQVPADDLPLIDRWALERLHSVTVECLDGYAEFEFRKVYNALNQFCAVDLSSIYIDITKDRMYCDSPDSFRRRSTQTAMHQIFDSLCRLLAPILSFTADEAWEHFGKKESVHLESLPAPDPAFVPSKASEDVDALLKLRGVVQQEIEKARQSKLIGSNLEAAVAITLAPDDPAQGIVGETDTVAEFLILSDLNFLEGTATSASVSKTAHAKCERCWRFCADVGSHESHSTLCERCATVVS